MGSTKPILAIIILLVLITAAITAIAIADKPPKPVIFMGGLIPPDRDYWEENIPKYPMTKAPTRDSIDWRSHNGKDYTTPPKSQGACGSCAAFAATSALESLMEIRFDSPNANYNMSEQHLFFCSGGRCNYGIDQVSVMDYLRYSGVPDEACFPYTAGDYGQDSSCSQTCSDWQSRAQKISSYYWAESQSAIKSALQNGPVVAGIEITNGLEYYTGGIYQGNDCSGPNYVNHGVAIVGYNDTDGYWIVKNSWSNYWGENGFFRIKYGKCGIDSWVMAMNYSGTNPDDDDDDDDTDDDDDDSSGDDDDDSGSDRQETCADLMEIVYNQCDLSFTDGGENLPGQVAYEMCQENSGPWDCIFECMNHEDVDGCSDLGSCFEQHCELNIYKSGSSSGDDDDDSGNKCGF